MPSEAAEKQSIGAADVRTWMINYIASVIDVPKDPFPVDDTFDMYGLDSVEVTIMSGMMEEEYGVEVNPNEFFDNPSVTAFSEHMAGRLAERPMPA